MSRAENILEGFTRYCGGPYSKTMVDILAELEQLNDDLWHMRKPTWTLQARINTAKRLLLKLSAEIDADEVRREP